jgi:hypothetical protein
MSSFRISLSVLIFAVTCAGFAQNAQPGASPAASPQTSSVAATAEALAAATPLTATNITGTGTPNCVPKFTTATNIADSQIYDSGTAVGIGTATPATTLDVNGVAMQAGGTQYGIYTGATTSSAIAGTYGYYGAPSKMGAKTLPITFHNGGFSGTILN